MHCLLPFSFNATILRKLFNFSLRMKPVCIQESMQQTYIQCLFNRRLFQPSQQRKRIDSSLVNVRRSQPIPTRQLCVVVCRKFLQRAARYQKDDLFLRDDSRHVVY